MAEMTFSDECQIRVGEPFNKPFSTMECGFGLISHVNTSPIQLVIRFVTVNGNTSHYGNTMD